MKKNQDSNNFEQNLKKLQDIVSWFEEHDEIDLEKSLEKIKEGSELLKECKKDLKEILIHPSNQSSLANRRDRKSVV